MTRRYWLILLTYIAAQFSFIVITPIIQLITPLDEAHALVYSNIIGFVIGFIAILIILKPEMMKQPVRGAADFGQVILWSFLGIFLAFGSQIIAGMIETYLFGIDAGSENTANLIEISRNIPLFTILPTIIAPVLEEIVFRKVIFGSLYKRFNFFIAGILSALIFGVVHLEIEHLLVYTAMGFVFAFLYVQTKRIIVPIIVHAAMNTLVVLYQLSLTPEQIEQMERLREQLQSLILP